MGSVATSDVTFSNAPDSSGPDSVAPKIEPDQDGYDSQSGSSIDLDQDHEAEGTSEKTSLDPPAPPKRKGGRKPVRDSHSWSWSWLTHNITRRSMRRRKSASNVIVKPRQPSENVEQNTSSSSNPPSSTTKRHCKAYSRVIVRLLTNVSC